MASSWEFLGNMVLSIKKASTKLRLQQASRMAATGERRTLFNLLFPISLIISFTLLYLAPLLAIQYMESSALVDFIKTYLDWSVLVVVIATLISYNKARRHMLLPYLKQVNDHASEQCRRP